MRLFFAFSYTRLKLMLSPSFIIGVCLFPLGLLFFGQIFTTESVVKIKVGLLYNHSATADYIATNFVDILGDLGEIKIYSDLEEMKRDVVTNQIECGFEILPDVAQKNEKLVNLYKTEQTMTDQISALMLVSGIIQTKAGEIGYSVLKDFFPDIPAEEIIETVQNRTFEYAKNSSLMSINYEIIDAERETPKTVIFNRASDGLTAFFAVLLSLLLAMLQTAERESSLFKKLISSGISKFQYLSFNNLFSTAVILAFMIFVRLLLGGVMSYLLVALYLCFALALSCFGSALAAIIKHSIFPAVIVFAVIFTALLGNCFFDISSILPSFNFAGLFFLSTYFLQGLNNPYPMIECFILAGFSLLFFAFTLRIKFLD